MTGPNAAMFVNRRPLKRKRRVTADLYDFLTFPAAGGGTPGNPDAPFRYNVRSFLARYAWFPTLPSILTPPLDGNPMTWRVAFRIGDDDDEGEEVAGTVELDIVEEDVPQSRSVYCDQCRIVGWSGHPVCGKRYHFIIRNDCNFASGSHRSCSHCGDMMDLSYLRCTSCNYELRTDDTEDLAFLQLENFTHLLHGVVHINGYGHLLRVNGRQGGSKVLTGSDIMDFWDRLCKMLRVRKVTVMDISKKHEMEYRLLHAVVAGCPWYGNWGYVFGTGSYGLTAEDYHEAIETLSSVPLSLFFTHARSPRTQLQDTIALYLSLSGQQLVTLRDLFRYVMALLHDARVPARPESFASQKSAEVKAVPCQWNQEDIGRAKNTIIKVLCAVGGSRWVSCRALRGAACGTGASPELLDYCLKGLGGKTFDEGMMVATRYDADTSSIQYRLQATSDESSATQFLCRPSAEHLRRDLKFLYDSLIYPKTMQRYKLPILESALSSAKKLLDCKKFVKHYDEPASNWIPSNPSVLHIWCHVELADQPKECPLPPPELLVIPVTATVADLKLQASRAFQQTYVLFQKFQAEQLLDYEHASDSTQVKLLIGLNGVVRVRGSCNEDERMIRRFRVERGPDNWIVDCGCGAKDDDGERMMACDVCEVWRHTRCAGIGDDEEVPVEFICTNCETFNNRPRGRISRRHNKHRSLGERCQDETVPQLPFTQSERYEQPQLLYTDAGRYKPQQLPFTEAGRYELCLITVE